jgi:hypothetical protein
MWQASRFGLSVSWKPASSYHLERKLGTRTGGHDENLFYLLGITDFLQ